MPLAELAEGAREASVDEVRDPGLEACQHRVRLRLRQAAGRDRSVELRLDGFEQGRDEPVDRLAMLCCDLRECLAALEFAPELLLRQAEIRRGRVEVGPVLVVPEAVGRSREQERQIA